MNKLLNGNKQALLSLARGLLVAGVLAVLGIVPILLTSGGTHTATVLSVAMLCAGAFLHGVLQAATQLEIMHGNSVVANLLSEIDGIITMRMGLPADAQDGATLAQHLVEALRTELSKVPLATLPTLPADQRFSSAQAQPLPVSPALVQQVAPAPAPVASPQALPLVTPPTITSGWQMLPPAGSQTN